jgi:alpha-aminoadipic semialdehyde synthase
VADITCDVHGSIEFLERSTSIERPFYQYDPVSEKEVTDDIGKTGVTVMGVDILPAELPRESSEHFGNSVTGVVQQLVHAMEQQDASVSGIDTTLLSPGLADSFITTADGSLTPGFEYLKTLMTRAHKSTIEEQPAMLLSLEGHLFDSGLINQVLDVVENAGCGLEFTEGIFPSRSGWERTKSSVVLKIDGRDESVLAEVQSKIQLLVDIIEKAEATLIRIDGSPEDGPGGDAPGRVEVEGPSREKRVLLLGAGRVSKTFVDYLGRQGDQTIIVAGENEKEAREVASAAAKGRHVHLDVTEDVHRLSELIEESDLVVSLLPAPMHPSVAMECIVHKKDFVTASYESEEMRQMKERAQDAGIVILNEVGLDPGLDHMSAMKIIDNIKSRGGTVKHFSSVCGGLPAPEVADNPFFYKFSWSPKGVIRASQSGARYRWEGRVLEVDGRQLLQSAAPFVEAWPDLELEVLPNRDSLQYEKVYDIGPEVPTIFRGTLRYRGFSSLLNIFQNMGLLDQVRFDEATYWADLIDALREQKGFGSVDDFVQACADEDFDETVRALKTLEWLNILGNRPVPASMDVVDAFCSVLEEKLCYEEGERDMVCMNHTIGASFEDGTVERHQSSLQVFGDSSATAMAKTVGYTAAASAKLLLDGTTVGECGLLLPTNPTIYVPVLESLEVEGIAFNECIEVNPPADFKEGHGHNPITASSFT